MRKFTIAIIGLGSRGAEAYGRIIFEQKDKFDIGALCDINKDKLRKYGEVFNVSECFFDENEFFEKRRADVLVIATMDKDHVRQCEKALSLGYDILLEKPVTDSEEECLRLLAAQKRYGGKVVVCHVLRYAPAYIKLREILKNDQTIGELVMIDAIEQVCYWHQAHSFVRGNWRNSKETSPMILQKCCHDMDILQYYANSKCDTISSIGGLKHFCRENMPAGAAERCTECPYVNSCVYSAVDIYIGNWKKVGSPDNCWPYNALTLEYPLTEEAIYQAIETGPYGRCVYACDNDVVDHQVVTMTFENGIKANLRMTAFTASGGRMLRLYCTKAQIDLDDADNSVRIKRFNQPEECISMNALLEGGHNHGGGDQGLIDDFYNVISGEAPSRTQLERSIESHLMAIRAEESRLLGGQLLGIHTK